LGKKKDNFFLLEKKEERESALTSMVRAGDLQNATLTDECQNEKPKEV